MNTLTLAPSRFTAAQLSSLPVVAVDFETYYDSEYSISDSSYYHYTHHPKFRAYLVSIVGPDFEFVGDPADFNWSRIDGMVWVSHNRPFDEAVYERLCALGIIPPILCHVGRDNHVIEEPLNGPVYWGDTAPLSVFLRCPRSLAGAVQSLYGITRSKEIRNVAMKGKSWEAYGSVLQDKIKLYALDDSRDCRRIWTEKIHLWPDRERWIADMMAERGKRGFTIDRESLDSDITYMEKVKFEATQKIPWAEDCAILSPKALRVECAKHGIQPPKSLALTDEECAAWEEEFGEQFEWIAAVRTYRRANTLLSRLVAMRDRVRDDGKIQFQLSYHAAHTGRSGGTGGVNFLNMPRAPFLINTDWNILHKKDELIAAEQFFKLNKRYPDSIARAIDFRSKLTASPGNILHIGDLAQIEARVGRWVVRDFETLRMIEEGYGVYEAHARRFMGFTGEDMKRSDPAGYQLAKARELALIFAVGWHKFITMARSYVDDAYFVRIFGAETTADQRSMFLQYIDSLQNQQTKSTYLLMWKRADEFTKNVYVNSWIQVSDFRRKNPEVVKMWNRLKSEMERSVGENYEIALPSGRVMTYFNVTSVKKGELQARVERGGPLSYFHGGLLFENVVQATARDVLVDAQLRAEEANFNVLLDVYDELVCDEPLSRDPAELLAVMTERPSWARGLPVGAEVETSFFYKK